MILKDWFTKAQKENFAIGAFNIDTLETLRGVLEAAKVKKSPVIVEFSPGEVGYFGLKNVIDLVENAKEEYRLPIFLNLDHGKTADACLSAIDLTNSDPGSKKGSRSGIGKLGFDGVHFDGSELEIKENIEGAKKVVEAAHAKGILVEGEIDKVSGASQIHTEELNFAQLRDSYTKPEQAAKFVAESGVDIFASVFGNIHGVFREQPPLDFSLLVNIKNALPNTFLSMHGGSGIPGLDVKRAINEGGIVKVNVNTELRQAYRDSLSEKMEERPNEYAFYNLSPDVIKAVSAVVEGKIEVLGSEGKA